MSLELRSQQLQAIERLRSGSILCGDVGSGKSRTALAYFFKKVCHGDLVVNGKGSWVKPTKPIDLYIITTAKKRDSLEWEEDALPFRIGKSLDASPSGIALTVDSWNNIEKYVEVKNAFFILDEQRVVGSGAWVKSFLKIAKSNGWILLSATPGDSWLDYIPVFVANGYYKNRTEFIREHVVYKRYVKYPVVERYIGEGRLQRLRRQLLVEMPVERHTKRHVRHVVVDHNNELLKRVIKKRWHVYEDRPIRDVGELFIVLRRVVNEDPSRLGAVMEIFEKHQRLIIFYNFNYELELLRTLATTLNVEVREWNGHKHEELPTGEKWIYLVQYTSGSEGWNCTTTNAEIFYSLNYSYKVNEQAKGRIDRLNTPYTDLYYYIFRSVSVIDNAILKSLSNKENFNERMLDFE